jgi:hypothetical protein
MVIEILATVKAFVVSLGSQLVSPAKRLWAERAAGRSDRAPDRRLLRSELETTLNRLAGFQRYDSWWRDALLVLGHALVTPEFLKSPSLQDWLAQADVRDDLVRLAERRALGEGSDDEAQIARLAASYEVRTGEAGALARGAIEVVLDVMIAGLQASLKAGADQTALAGLVQGANAENIEARAELAEISAKLDPIARIEAALLVRGAELPGEARSG